MVEVVVPDADGEKQWWSASRVIGLNRPIDRDAEIGHLSCADRGAHGGGRDTANEFDVNIRKV